MIALARLLATLHDEEGNVAVDGMSGFAWDGADLSAEEFRSIADLLAGVGLSGSGPVGERLWSRPSVSAIGIDTTSVAGSSNVLIPEARAKLSMPIVPDRIRNGSWTRWSATWSPMAPGVPRWRSSGSTQCLGSAVRPTVPPMPPPGAPWRRPTASRLGEAGSGGSIPLLQTLQQVAPNAEFVLWGPRTWRPRGSTPRTRVWTPPRSSG